MTMEHSTEGPEVLIERRDNIAIITLNRPQTRNAISLTLGENLLHALNDVDGDPDIGAVVLTGAGPTFCAGAKLGDIIGPEGVDRVPRDRGILYGIKAVQKLRTMDLPVVCAVRGVSVGGGAAIAMACDLVVAADDAAYYFAFGRVGASAADFGCAHMLSRMVGTAKARHILLTGMRVNAQLGWECGLFIDVVSGETLLDQALALARSVAASGPRDALAATKQILLRGENIDFETCLYYENFVQTHFLNTDEHLRRVKVMVDGFSKNKR